MQLYLKEENGTAYIPLVEQTDAVGVYSAELENGNYTSEYQYVEMFGQEDYVYTLNKGAELAARMNEIYTEFANWLGSWEM